jgi:hypothetical protein
MMLAVGQVLHGYCGGYFGRNSHECRRVEAVGFDWVVARRIDRPAIAEFAEGMGIHDKLEGYTKTTGDCECS